MLFNVQLFICVCVGIIGKINTICFLIVSYLWILVEGKIMYSIY